MEVMTICSFDGTYSFLSNFHHCKVEYNGIEYGHTEGAFQAQKTLSDNDRKYIATLTPAQSKKACGRRGLNGFKIDLRDDWEQIKDQVMLDVLRIKFSDKELKEKLLNTGDAVLVEGNRWHDNYWGNCYCEKCINIEGKNTLGKLLMQVRREIKG